MVPCRGFWSCRYCIFQWKAFLWKFLKTFHMKWLKIPKWRLLSNIKIEMKISLSHSQPIPVIANKTWNQCFFQCITWSQHEFFPGQNQLQQNYFGRHLSDIQQRMFLLLLLLHFVSWLCAFRSHLPLNPAFWWPESPFFSKWKLKFSRGHKPVGTGF